MSVWGRATREPALSEAEGSGAVMFHLTLKAALAAREPDEHISREEAMEMRKWQLCAESSE